MPWRRGSACSTLGESWGQPPYRNLDLEKVKQEEDEYVKQTIEEDKDKKMKMSNKTVEEDKPRTMDFAMYLYKGEKPSCTTR